MGKEDDAYFHMDVNMRSSSVQIVFGCLLSFGADLATPLNFLGLYVLLCLSITSQYMTHYTETGGLGVPVTS